MKVTKAKMKTIQTKKRKNKNKNKQVCRECGKPAIAKNYCKKHYEIAWRRDNRIDE